MKNKACHLRRMLFCLLLALVLPAQAQAPKTEPPGTAGAPAGRGVGAPEVAACVRA